MAGANVVFAADGEDCGCNADKNYVQVAPETQIAKPADSRIKNDIDYVMKDIAGYVWSVITPDEALAATDVQSCQDQCRKWKVIFIDDPPFYTICCKKWKRGASPECKAQWGCPPRKPQKHKK